jgi:hypothetical protein
MKSCFKTTISRPGTNPTSSLLLDSEKKLMILVSFSTRRTEEILISKLRLLLLVSKLRAVKLRSTLQLVTASRKLTLAVLLETT